MGLFNKMLDGAAGIKGSVQDAFCALALRRPRPYLLVRVLAPLSLAGTCMAALAQADPPGRVARLGNAEGPVTYSAASDDEWTDAELNRPLVRGDRLWTDKGSRADVQVGSAAVRMDGQTQLQIVAVDDQNAQLRVSKGSVFVRVRLLPEGENFEVVTPNLAFRAAYPGDYRLDVDPQWGTTRVTIVSGMGTVYGEGGQSMSLGGGQQIMYKARALAKVDVRESPPQDNFSRWADERNRREDQSVAARYVPRDVVGYQSLDSAGKWADDTTYGAVWFPESTPANWAPFRNGRWEWIAPWGWTWIDKAPWGFACSHYGRWAIIGNRWAWVPGRMAPRPIFSPALVAFIGRPDRWSAPLAGKLAVAWFPLGPGEPWQPGFRATPLYISGVNHNMSPVPVGNTYAFQSNTAALTTINADDFSRGKPVVGRWMRVAGNVLTQAQIVPPPPMPTREPAQLVARAAPAADIRTVAHAQRPVTPPPAADEAQQAQRNQQLVQEAQARAAEKAQAEKAQAEKAQAEKAQAEKAQAEKAQAEKAQAEKAQAEKAQAEKARQEAARQVERARTAEQARAAQEARQAQATANAAHAAARQAERARAAEQSRQAEAATKARQEAARAQAAQKVKVAEQSRRAEQKSREAQARSAAEAKREQAARSEKAKREQVAAKQRERQRRQQAAHAKAQREDQARRTAAAKKDKEDQARRAAARAQQVELAQRAADHYAQALREQRQRREEPVRRQAEDDALRETSQRRTQRPDLRTTPAAPTQPEVWQRGTPVLPQGRAS